MANTKTTASALAKVAAPIFRPGHQAGLTSLLTQTYGKPVQLNFIQLSQPHHDADILAQVTTAKLLNRRNTARKVIRDVTWKVNLPTQVEISRLQQERQHRASSKQPLTLADLTHKIPEKIGDVLKDLRLPQVSSLRVQASGRLTKRISADQAQSKFTRRGTTNKGPAHLLRGFQKSTVVFARRAGKRRIGAFGVKVHVGHF